MFVVGVSVKDVAGSQAAMKSVIGFAQLGEKISAIHVPRMVSEMLLSSINDPSDASEDALAALLNSPTKAGASAQQKMREAADAEMKRLSEDVDIEYTVGAPTGDVRTALLAACRVEGANLLVIGPGLAGKGSITPFVAGHADGLTVCILRDRLN